MFHTKAEKQELALNRLFKIFPQDSQKQAFDRLKRFDPPLQNLQKKEISPFDFDFDLEDNREKKQFSPQRLSLI